MIHPDEIIQTARAHLGTPWEHQGRQRDHGLDCLGLAVVTLQAHGYQIQDRTDYSTVPSGLRMIRALREYLLPASASNIKPGHILHMAFRTEPQHVAIVTGVDPLRIIHADRDAGTVVEHGLGDLWHNIRGVYAIPGVEH